MPKTHSNINIVDKLVETLGSVRKLYTFQRNVDDVMTLDKEPVDLINFSNVFEIKTDTFTSLDLVTLISSEVDEKLIHSTVVLRRTSAGNTTIVKVNSNNISGHHLNTWTLNLDVSNPNYLNMKVTEGEKVTIFMSEYTAE